MAGKKKSNPPVVYRVRLVSKETTPEEMERARERVFDTLADLLDAPDPGQIDIAQSGI